MQSFGDKLAAAGADRGRICVGIDPHSQLLKDWGLTDSLAGLKEFTKRCVEAFAPTAAIVKPQVAFFERYGAAGFAVLEEAIAELRDGGALVLADAKRGDIGSTMAGYATAWLADDSPLCADALTVSPYLGVGALAPVFELAQATGRGVYVLAATSNPEAVALQTMRDISGRTVAQSVIDELSNWNEGSALAGKYGPYGVVLGATVKHPLDLAKLRGPVLLPGVGAQGGTRADVEKLTGKDNPVAFASVSRSVLSAGPCITALRKALLAC
ncbi:orotidine-5'-phosphate decarboxylase [Corynebacterium caspium]|uniref:orotidine-5'-phosphate decarboxylase n=1 Tax=Corynebacterium caspium TaxID=234828 RepID=UPI00036A1C5F|nr:orotidine-5'-phosphate decarboxylase [Corynebacterium caspium]WKD59216.1 orotidine 5'-phosphate decarboxylase [Corynebacterium caspium DSM 44850]